MDALAALIAENDRQDAQMAYIGTMLWSMASQQHAGFHLKGDFKLPKYSELFDENKPVQDNRTGEEIRQAVIESLRKRRKA